jgi:dienelactone hydrolase
MITSVRAAIFASIVLASSLVSRAGELPKLVSLRTPGGVEFTVAGERPSAPAPVLFLIASDAQRTLGDPAYGRIATLLAEKGFVCVSLDAPCHGKDNTEHAENPLAAWRTRIERGDDLVGDFNRKCTEVLDYLVAERYADPARAAAAGISRGGFLALHWAAAEPRVRCVAAFSPVTELMALAELFGAKDPQRVEMLDLRRVAAKLADRPIWVTIGNNDERVGTDRAIAFTRDVVRAAAGEKRPALVELHITTTPGHSTPVAAHDEAAAWVAATVARLKRD